MFWSTVMELLAGEVVNDVVGVIRTEEIDFSVRQLVVGASVVPEVAAMLMVAAVEAKSKFHLI